LVTPCITSGYCPTPSPEAATPSGDDGAAPQTEDGHALPLDGTAAHALPVPRRADDRRGGPQPLTRASRQLLHQVPHALHLRASRE
ncbi:hypothetical protein T484DRAFT_1919641, partial [Baffinella frigidus]